MTSYKEAIDFEHLYESAMKCKRNVLWKNSVSNFMLNVSKKVEELSVSLNNGTYVSKQPTRFKVYTPNRLTREQKILIEKLNNTSLETDEIKRFDKFTKKNG